MEKGTRSSANDECPVVFNHVLVCTILYPCKQADSVSSVLVYALLQFCVPLAFSAYFCVMSYAAAVENHGLVAAVQAVNPYLNDIFCFSAPVCLLATRYAQQWATICVKTAVYFSGAVRQAYKDTYWCRSSSEETRVTPVSSVPSNANPL